MEAPMPLDAPVTTATFPSSFFMMSFGFVFGYVGPGLAAGRGGKGGGAAASRFGGVPGGDDDERDEGDKNEGHGGISDWRRRRIWRAGRGGRRWWRRSGRG